MPQTTELPVNLASVKDLTAAMNDRIRQTNNWLQTEYVHNAALSDVDLGSNRITNLADPTDDLDAVNLRTVKKFQATSSGNGVVNQAVQVPVTFGLEDDTAGTNIAGKYGVVWLAGRPVGGYISVVGKPTSADTVLDIQYSRDKGLTWKSIFPSATARKAIFPLTEAGFVVSLNTFAPGVTFPLGALLRCDGVQTGGATGVLLVLIYEGD